MVLDGSGWICPYSYAVVLPEGAFISKPSTGRRHKGAKRSIAQDGIRKIIRWVLGNYAKKQLCCSLPTQMSLKRRHAARVPRLQEGLCRRGMCWGSLEAEASSLQFFFLKQRILFLVTGEQKGCQSSSVCIIPSTPLWPVGASVYTWYILSFWQPQCLTALATNFSRTSLLKGWRGIKGKTCSFLPSEPGSHLAHCCWKQWNCALSSRLALRANSLSLLTSLRSLTKIFLGPRGTRGPRRVPAPCQPSQALCRQLCSRG